MFRRPLVWLPVLLVSVVQLGGCALVDNHMGLTLRFAVAEGERGGPDATTDPRDVTAEMCGEKLDCVEAYTTVEATYLRFGSRQRAAEYAETLSDGFLVNYIVMDFTGHDAPKERQELAMMYIANIWQDYHGGYPER